MKYWCPECKSEYVVGEKPTPGYCTMLDDELEDDGEECGEILVKLPAFETPSQYEKRTGKKWNGAVWQRVIIGRENGWTRWDARRYPEHFKSENQILCAASPEPPPYDYVPEVEA